MRRPAPGEVLTLAPDDASARAARLLARPEPWDAAGCSDRGVWGHCRGTARQPYDVAVDIGDFGYRCTCPSQKQPCKHVVALLLLWADGSPVVAPGPAPAEVAAWLATRPEPSPGSGVLERVSGQSRPLSPAPPVGAPTPAPAERDATSAAARAGQRAERIAAGMAELDLWLRDLLRAGLASAAAQPYSYWDTMAARLVDAQAPGAALSVREMAAVPHTGEGWPGRLLGRVARLHLLAAGWARYARLPEAGQADLRTAAGWPWPAETVLAGRRERDRWYVLARVAIDDPQLQVQRTWLWGLDSGRPALIVDFARPGSSFGWQLWPGEVLDAEVARYPGSAPLRVRVADQTGEPEAGGPPPGWDDLGAVAEARGRALATDPWCERWPVSVRGVVPERAGGSWRIRDEAGRAMPLTGDGAREWKLAAVSGGHRVQVLGEWAGEGVTPLAVWAEDRMVVL